MTTKLYIVPGSHPCDTVAKALELKGIDFKTVEFPPPSHALLMRPLFGGRTVPGIKFEDGTKIQGSSKILRELDRRVPEPSLRTDDPRVEEAERWGDEVLQPLVRRVLWMAFTHDAASLHGYQAGKGPKLPLGVIKASAPLITKIERGLNDTSDEAARADLAALPGHLDKVDAWIAAGTLGGEPPNAADLQIATSLRLLHTIGDVKPLMAGRPAEELAHRWYAPLPGSTPAGLLT
jgi:glutathione S-transferase